MKKESWNYISAVIGFFGTLLMALAISEIKDAGHSDSACVQRLTEMGTEMLKAIQQCEYYLAGMKHPYWNWVGLFLLCAAFLIQILPGLPKAWKWCRKYLQKFKLN